MPALQGKRGQRVRYVLHSGVETDRVVLEPAQVGLGRRHAELALAEARDGAVVQHLAGGVAPGRVPNLSDFHVLDAARHHKMQQARRVLASHAIFVERRDIEQSGGAPNRVVFPLVREFVRARHDIASPAAPRVLAQIAAVRG